MGVQLRKSSESPLATVSQEFRRIVMAEPDAAKLPRGVFRRVQIMVPPSPGVVLITTPDPRFPDIKDIARAAGPNRVYKGTPLPPGAQLTIELGPDQECWAAAVEGFARIGMFISYYREG